jgi:DNA-binding response OmpR family regulator
LLTARRDKKDIEHAIALGVDDYIVKPIDPMLLIKKVQGLFDRKPAADRPTFDLKEIETKMLGQIQIEASILAVSEIGLVVETSQQLMEGQSLTLDSNLFDQMRIPAPLMKVLSVENLKHSKVCRAKLLFVGTDESTLQKVRAWINIQASQKRVKAA